MNCVDVFLIAVFLLEKILERPRMFWSFGGGIFFFSPVRIYSVTLHLSKVLVLND